MKGRSIIDLPENPMRLSKSTVRFMKWVSLFGALSLATTVASAQAKAPACPEDQTGLHLPGGFCGTLFADRIGHARHLVVSPSGVVYVNTWSGVYYGKDVPHSCGFL